MVQLLFVRCELLSYTIEKDRKYRHLILLEKRREEKRREEREKDGEEVEERQKDEEIEGREDEDRLEWSHSKQDCCSCKPASFIDDSTLKQSRAERFLLQIEI